MCMQLVLQLLQRVGNRGLASKGADHKSIVNMYDSPTFSVPTSFSHTVRIADEL